MLLWISFGVVFLIIFSLFYFFLTLDPKLERLQKVRGRIRMVKQGEEVKSATSETTTSLFRDISVSDIPALNLMLVRFRQTARLQKLIDQSNVQIKAGVIILLTGFLLVAGYALMNLLFGVPALGALLFALALGAVPFAYITFRRWQRFHQFESQFPGALDLIARALKAGYSFPNALEMTSAELPDPVSLELKVIYNLQSLGWTLRQTLMNFVDRVPLPDVKLFVTAALIHKDVGGNLAEVLENTAGVIRQRFVLRRQLRSMTAQARMSGHLMTGLPFGVIGALMIIAPEYIKVMFDDPLGRTLLEVGIVMLLTGVFAIRKLLRIKEL